MTPEEIKNENLPTEIIISIKRWTNTDKFNCPKCNNKIGLNEDNKYICQQCNIRLKPIIKF